MLPLHNHDHYRNPILCDSYQNMWWARENNPIFSKTLVSIPQCSQVIAQKGINNCRMIKPLATRAYSKTLINFVDLTKPINLKSNWKIIKWCFLWPILCTTNKTKAIYAHPKRVTPQHTETILLLFIHVRRNNGKFKTKWMDFNIKELCYIVIIMINLMKFKTNWASKQ